MNVVEILGVELLKVLCEVLEACLKLWDLRDVETGAGDTRGDQNQGFGEGFAVFSDKFGMGML